MNANKTVNRLMISSPLLFRDRIVALLHLFCTNGNGFKWVDGELIDKHEDLPESEDLPEEPFDKAFWDAIYHHSLIPHIDEGWSYLTRFPSDIKPDWKEALIEIAEYIIYFEKKNLERIKNLEKNPLENENKEKKRSIFTMLKIELPTKEKSEEHIKLAEKYIDKLKEGYTKKE